MTNKTNQPENPFEKWLSVPELINLLGISFQAIHKNISTGKYRVQEVDGMGRGGKQYLIALSSIPLSAQLEYWQEHYGIEDINGTEHDNLGRILSDDKSKADLLRKESILQKAFLVRNQGKKVTAKLTALAKESKIGLATLYRWLDEYEKGGLFTLARDNRKDAGISRAFDSDAVEYMKIEYIKILSKTEAYKRTLQKAVEKNWRFGSQRTAMLILEKVPKEQLLITREGKKGLNDKIVTPILRDHSILRPLEIVFGDHHELDIMCRDQYGHFRPWLSAWMDARTRTISGFCLNRQPNSMTIGLALRHAVSPKLNPEYTPYGIAETVYIDNGKDYRSHFLSGKSWKERRFKVDFNLDAKLVLRETGVKEVSPGLFKELGIAEKFALPYNAKAKMIERWFSTLISQFSQFLPGWTGRNTKERPTEKLEMEMATGKCLTLQELFPLIEQYIIEYHRAPHRGLKGATPEAVWKEYLESGWQPKTVVNERLFDMLLLKEERRKVNNLGVQLFNEYFVSDQLVLAHYGQWVTVRYDPFDLSEVHIFKDNQYICTAESYHYATMRDSKEDVSARIAAQRRQAKTVMNRRKNLLNRQEQITGESDANKRDAKIIFLHPDQAEADKLAKSKEKIKEKRATNKQADGAWEILSRFKSGIN